MALPNCTMLNLQRRASRRTAHPQWQGGHKFCTRPYGRRLAGLNIPAAFQQSSDRMSDEGVTWPWMANYAGCVLMQSTYAGDD